MSDSHDAVQLADAIAFTASRAHMDHLLRQLTELLEALFVAGLAYPQPDLLAGLPELIERSAALGLEGLVARLGALEVALASTRAANNEVEHAEATRQATEALQHLSAWQRLYRREHALLLVAGRLAAQAEGVAMPQARVPTADLVAWPIGARLEGASLEIFALELGARQHVVFHDHLSDLSPLSPLARPVISRLFQAQLPLRAMLSAVIQLEAHPVALRAEVLHVNPAFRCAPRLLDVAPSFLPPHPPTLAAGQIGRALGRFDAEVDATGQHLLDPAGASLSIAVGETLRFNLVKWRAQVADPTARLALILAPSEDQAEVIAAEDPWGDLALPHLDPAAFRWSPKALYALASSASGGDAVDRRLLLTTAGLFGALGDQGLDALRGAWLDTRPEGVLAWGRAAQAWALLGLEPAEADIEALLDLATAALALGAQPKETPLRVSQLAPVLGLPPAQLAKVDRRAISGALLFTALRLIDTWGDLSDRLELLKALYAARYQSPSAAPTVGDVCARALLLRALAEAEAEADTQADTPADAGAALAYLDAFLQDLRPRAGRPTPAPLPTLREILDYATARALLTSQDTLRGSVAALDLPPLGLARLIADGLLALARAPDSAEAARAAANGLLCAIDRKSVV